MEIVVLKLRDWEAAVSTIHPASRVDDFAHELPIFIIPRGNDQYGETCGVCKKFGGHSAILYFCQNCQFYVHPDCAKIRRPWNLIHEHPLEFLENIPDKTFRCSECGKFCCDKVYGCSSCSYFIHTRCHPVQMMDRQVEHLCHPSRPLIGYVVRPRSISTLNTKGTEKILVSCDICCRRGERGRDIFHCNKCDFNVDVECIDVSPADPPTKIKMLLDNLKDGVDKQELRSYAKYYSHEHPLMLFNKIPKDRFECRVCGKYCSNSVYGCVLCAAFFLHPSCAELKLPLEIQHFYHSCILTLYTKPDDLVVQQENDPVQTSNVLTRPCRACDQKIPARAFYYGCRLCLFVMDIDCTLLPSLLAGSTSQIKHHPIFHGHPLSLLSMKKNDDNRVLYCVVCGKGCNSDNIATYYCGRSTCRDVYIDESCIELPLKICHPFHLDHPLFLLELKGPRGKCNACRNDTPAFAYICQHRNCSTFSLDVICSKMGVPSIKYEAHSHLLHFREKTDDQLKCNACDKSCESSTFTCLYCDWNLHYTCGPLPKSITCKCHKDPLILTNALPEHEDEMDDEFYCDICETQRDPLLPSYQCIGCNFVAETRCVISEITSLLRGDSGDDVESRDPFGQCGKLIMLPKNTSEDQMMEKKEEEQKPTLMLSKILKSLNEDEIMELRRVLEARGMRDQTAVSTAEQRFFNDPREDNVLHFSDKDYTQFIKFLDRGTEISLELRDGEVEVLFRSLDQIHPYDYFALEEELVDVEHYKAPRTFVPILSHLLSEHGDISAKSTLNPNVKLFFLNMLCGCIYSMRNTKVVDITKDLLLIWWTSLRACQEAGFEIKSLFDHLKRVARAFFGLYVATQADKFKRDFAKLSEDLEELKRKHDLVEECLMEASVLKQGKAITGRSWDQIKAGRVETS